MNNLKVENKFIDYFKKNTEIYQGMTELDEKLGGTATLDIIIYEPDNYLDDKEEISEEFDDLFDEDIFDDDNSESSGYWWNIYNLKRLEEIHDYLDDNENIGKVLSVSSGIKLARKINDNNELNDLELALLRSVLPEDIKNTVLNSYISNDDSIVRISSRVYESSESLNRELLLKTINSDLQQKFGISSDKFKITGLAVLYNNMLQSLFSSMLNSILIVYTVIALMLLVLFRSVKIMLAGLLPNILIGFGVLGTMGLLSIPLDIMTITVASISVGIAVDNTIHYLYKFKSEYELKNNFNEAMIRSHSTIGRAIFYTASTISLGFLIFSFSNFIPTIYFGIFTALAMFFAFLVSLTLLPILLEKMRAFE
jgi:predicted RND superfamily exporter protein